MNLNKRIEDKLHEIADFLINYNQENEKTGALSGLAGIALFHFFYSRFTNNRYHHKKGELIIEKIILKIKAGQIFPSYCDGLCGALYILEILKRESFIDYDDSNFDNLDIYLFDKMRFDLENNYFDFLHGALGYGWYFTEKFLNSKNSRKEIYFNFSKYLLKELENSSIEDYNGKFWKSNIMFKKVNIEVSNLGMSHGLPSFIMLLSKMTLIDQLKEKSIKLLKGASDYLISSDIQNLNGTARYPNWIDLNNRMIKNNSRLAWCYGDLGISVALHKASKVLNSDSLYSWSKEILMNSTERTNINEAGVKDAGLCHGAFGIMLLYKSLNASFNNTSIQKASELWATKGLSLGCYKDGYAVFKSGNGKTWFNDDSLLEGVSGIGLSIISYLSKSNLAWEEALLIDI